MFGRVDGRYTAVYTALVHVGTCTLPYTCRVHGRVHGPYMAVYTSRVLGGVRAMYTAEDVRTDGPYTAVYGPCMRHGRYTVVYVLFSQAKACSRVVCTAAV